MGEYQELDRVVVVLGDRGKSYAVVLEMKGGQLYLLHTIGVNYVNRTAAKVAARDFVAEQARIGDKHKYHLDI